MCSCWCWNALSVFGVELKGRLPEFVSAKDVILEMLRRHKVTGGKDKIIEYYGDGLKHLTGGTVPLLGLTYCSCSDGSARHRQHGC